MAKTSCRREPDGDGLRPSLVVLESLGKNAQREYFCFRHGLVGSGSIGENSGEFGDFSKPAPVFFAFVFNCEFHVSPRRLDEFYARSHFATQRSWSAARGIMRVGCTKRCAPDMGMSLWGESPLQEYRTCRIRQG